ncbi:NAD(P)/FAD-dependent oxidoreductase [Oryzibacter oryziterrae]|uniref:NAD(P)/FAD-dependent oxidoreductase n=1 Tax=Oryzibacter oryziterrae TaxID=2766474 RepID=UPI001F2541B1|nr:FAD-dependent oxidoreductase [Oryzibacter oryziterrae]
MSEHVYDVVTIGGGPAGMAAALAARKAGAERVLIIERDHELGGILQQCIHNGFGLRRFKTELTGPGYAQRYVDMVGETDIDIWLDTTVLETAAGGTVRCVSPDKGVSIVKAKSVVHSMGCRERTRGAIRTPGSRPAGVFTAGAAQRMVNMEGYLPGREVVIVGSGDIGLIMARRMTLEGAKVKAVFEIMPHSNGLTRNIVQCLDDFGIPLYLSHSVVSVHGNDRVTGITVAKVDEKLQPIAGTEFDLDCDTVLLSVGLIPENELGRGAGVAMDPITSGASVDQFRRTSVPGFFAAGNVLHVHDLVDFVSQEAEIAGRAAALNALGLLPDAGTQKPVHAGPGLRTVVPQLLSAPEAGKLTVRFYFRGSQPLGRAVIQLRADGEVVWDRKLKVVKPSEMIVADIPVSLLYGDGQRLEFSIEPLPESADDEALEEEEA